MDLLENEIYSMTLTPWTTANPRNDHQLIFPLSDGRLLFVWCEYYLKKPSQAFCDPYSRDAQDDAPCRISAKVSKDKGRTWSEKITFQDNTGVDNVKHPNLLRLPSGRILFSYTQRDMTSNDLRVYLKYSDDECETWSRPVKISPEDGIYYTNADHILRQFQPHMRELDWSPKKIATGLTCYQAVRHAVTDCYKDELLKEAGIDF